LSRISRTREFLAFEWRAAALLAGFVPVSWQEVSMEYLFLLGRVLFGGLWLYYGVRHFQNASMMAGYVASKGVPAARLAILVSGALLLLGGLSMLLGLYPTWGIACLTVFLVPTTLIMHNFWVDTDPSARMNNLINFHKNMALLGALWMMTLLPQPWVLSLG
jgi:putative oxidoreductase